MVRREKPSEDERIVTRAPRNFLTIPRTLVSYIHVHGDYDLGGKLQPHWLVTFRRLPSDWKCRKTIVMQ